MGLRGMVGGIAQIGGALTRHAGKRDAFVASFGR
jgi:hypothetical protein